MLTPIDIQNHSLKTAVRGYSKKETDDFLEEILQGYESLYKENRELKDKVASLSEGVQYYKQMETTLQKALVLAEKTSTETQEAAKSKADAMTNEAQAKADSLTKEAQAKADSLLTEAQTKANSLLTEAQTRADSLLTEAQTKADSLLTEAQTKSDSMLKEAQVETDGLRKEIHAYSDITKAKANRELEETRNHVRKLVQSYETYRLQFKKLAESQIEMLESENYSIFVPELAEMLDDAPDADTAMETQKTVAINLKSSEQIAQEKHSVLEEAAVGQENAATSEEARAVNVPDFVPEYLNAEGNKPEIHASDMVSGSANIEEKRTEIYAGDMALSGVSVEEKKAEIHAGDMVPGGVNIEEKKAEIHAGDMVPGGVNIEEKKAEIHAGDMMLGGVNIEEKKAEIYANDVVPGSINIEEKRTEINLNTASSGSVSVGERKSEINLNKMGSDSVNVEERKPEINTKDTDSYNLNANQEIRATDIVPGNPAAFVHNNITPKIEGFEGAPTKTVMPNNNSPFTFIDID